MKIGKSCRNGSFTVSSSSAIHDALFGNIISGLYNDINGHFDVQISSSIDNKNQLKKDKHRIKFYIMKRVKSPLKGHLKDRKKKHDPGFKVIQD